MAQNYLLCPQDEETLLLEDPTSAEEKHELSDHESVSVTEHDDALPPNCQDFPYGETVACLALTGRQLAKPEPAASGRDGQPGGAFRRGHAAALLVGIVAIASIMSSMMITPHSGPEHWTVRRLLESEELSKATAAQALALGGGRFTPQERAAMENSIGVGLRRYAAEVGQGGKLKMQLPDQQMRAIFQLVGSLHDPRLQALGLRIADVLKPHAQEGHESMRHRLTQEVEVSREELTRLRDDIVPPALRPQARDQGGNSTVDWDFILSTDWVRLMSTYDGWHATLSVTGPKIDPARPMVRRLSESQPSPSGPSEAPGSVATSVFQWIAFGANFGELIVKTLKDAGHVDSPDWLGLTFTSTEDVSKVVTCALQDIDSALDMVICLFNAVLEALKVVQEFITGDDAGWEFVADDEPVESDDAAV